MTHEPQRGWRSKLGPNGLGVPVTSRGAPAQTPSSVGHDSTVRQHMGDRVHLDTEEVGEL